MDAMDDAAPANRQLAAWWTWLPPALAALGVLVLGWTDLNAAAHGWLQARLAPVGTTAWRVTTTFGDALVVLGLLGLLVRRRPELLPNLYLAALATVVLVQGAKAIVDLPRPCAVLAFGAPSPFGLVLSHRSFPSGHAAAAALPEALLALGVTRRRWLRAALLAGAAAVALSRVALGVHWPMDVLAGFAVGWLGGAVAAALPRRPRRFARPATLRLLALPPLVAAALLLGPWLEDATADARLRLALGVLCLLWGALAMAFPTRRPGAGHEPATGSHDPVS